MAQPLLGILSLPLRDGVLAKPFVLDESGDDGWLDLEQRRHFSVTLALFSDHLDSFLELVHPKLSLGKLAPPRLA